MMLFKLFKKSLILFLYFCLLGILASCVSDEIIYKDNKSEMKFTSVDGKKINLLDYKGKFLIVNYWASWCSPCVKEIPELIEFNKKYKDKANIIGINIEHIDANKLNKIIKNFKINYPNLKEDVIKKLLDIDIVGFPTTYIFNKKGHLVKTIQGPLLMKTLSSYIQ
tara:strand:- start:22983 stop:23480 length:498 start_codon:yes stop_codon:yes gene_type:complete